MGATVALTDVYVDPSHDLSTQVPLRVQAALFVALLAGALLTRIPTLFLHAIGTDESLYYTIAAQWRAGHLPYTQAWDNKPIGIYAIFAIFQWIFGEDIAAIRIAAVVFIAITAFLVAKITLLIPSSDTRASWWAAAAAAATYLVCSLSNSGLESNTEIFMVAFSTCAVWLSLRLPSTAKSDFLAGFFTGLLLGLAFMTKYVVICEAPSLAFALIVVKRRTHAASWLKVIAGGVIGCLVPILAALLLYVPSGQVSLWLGNSVLSNLRRANTSFQIGALLVQRLVEWAPLWAVAILSAGRFFVQLRNKGDSQAKSTALRFHGFLILWLVCASLGVAAAKGFYSHFFLEVLPVLCVTLGWVLVHDGKRLMAWPASLRLALLLAFWAIPILAAAATLFKASPPVLSLKGNTIRFHADTALQIARDIDAAPPTKHPRLYDFDYNMIIYSLAHAPIPTRYPFPLFMSNCFLAYVADLDAPKEEARILSTDPEFVLRAVPSAPSMHPWEQHVFEEINSDLSERYVLYRQYDGALLYRLRPGAPPYVVPTNFSGPRCSSVVPVSGDGF